MEPTARSRLWRAAMHLHTHAYSAAARPPARQGATKECVSCTTVGHANGSSTPAHEFGLSTDEAEMLEDNRYLFDLQGFCVVPDVLSVSEVGELNAIIDGHPAMDGRGNNDWVGNARFGENPGAYQDLINATADKWRGNPGFLDWGLPFTRLLDHPRVLPYLAMLLDGYVPGCTQAPMTYTTASTGIRLDRCYGIEQTPGSFRQGGFHQDWEGQYAFQRGALRNSLVVVAWNLTDSGGISASQYVSIKQTSIHWRCSVFQNTIEPCVVWMDQATLEGFVRFLEGVRPKHPTPVDEQPTVEVV